jgi:hypothetical protein
LTGDWIQVEFSGEFDREVLDQLIEDAGGEEALAPGYDPDSPTVYGWIADWLLIWTGDILALPVDGVPTFRFARRSGPLITIEPGTRYYVDGIDPSTRVMQTVTEPTEVELTGRVGSGAGGYFWVQFRLNGAYYWTASWEVDVPRGYFALPDGSYLYAYGRLLIQLQREANRFGNVLSDIGGRWRNLDAGSPVSCNNIPDALDYREDYFKDLDISREQIYIPVKRALDDAIVNINDAIALFADVCARQGVDRFVTPDEARQALEWVDGAGRNLTLARTLSTPLASRDPLLGNKD